MLSGFSTGLLAWLMRNLLYNPSCVSLSRADNVASVPFLLSCDSNSQPTRATVSHFLTLLISYLLENSVKVLKIANVTSLFVFFLIR